MPSGYTAYVQDGTITTLKEFALLCARNFGALVTMRDESLLTPIPNEFQPNDYSLRKLKECEKKFKEISSLTKEEIRQYSLNEYKDKLKRRKNSLKTISICKARYTSMLDQITKWNPSIDHAGLKEFMEAQIKESLNFDCGQDYSEIPMRLSSEEWLTKELNEIKRDITYYTEEYKKEVERTDARNKWVNELRNSL